MSGCCFHFHLQFIGPPDSLNLAHKAPTFGVISFPLGGVAAVACNEVDRAQIVIVARTQAPRPYYFEGLGPQPSLHQEHLGPAMKLIGPQYQSWRITKPPHLGSHLHPTRSNRRNEGHRRRTRRRTKNLGIISIGISIESNRVRTR